MNHSPTLRLALFAMLSTTAACGFTSGQTDLIGQGDTQTVPARHTTLIADGCTLDAWQMEALASPMTKRFVAEVVLLCLVPRSDGTVGPNDPSARAELDTLVGQIQGLGYQAKLGASFTTENGYVFDPAQEAAKLADAAWVGAVTTNIADLAHAADGVELDLEQLPASARPGVTSLAAALAAKIRPQKQLGVFLPPSDVASAAAFDVGTLAQYTDRFRVMTLDFSDQAAGPTIDSGWAVDMVRAVKPSAGSAAVDVSFPLYGNDFSSGVRPVSYLEAVGLAGTFGAKPQRSASQELFFDYVDAQDVSHELWYDDTQSTLATLRAWDSTALPLDVGVVLYGFGSEDPTLLQAVGQATP
ncbi:MAG TPA: hypothetical protein VLM85_10090 [Polyangiaceae bacterium]|nr:hypothetical protein [Polyangiaceae bacterium]